MNIILTNGTYNERRYGRPWIATVDFSDPKGVFTFGAFIGANGEAGERHIEAEAGQIIAYGQKDNRNSRNSAPTFAVVNADGSVTDLGSKIEAYNLWKVWDAAKKQTAAPVVDIADFCI